MTARGALFLVALALLSGCATTGGPDGLPGFSFRGLDDSGSPLLFALREADQIADLSNRIFLFAEIASVYVERGEFQNAAHLLRYLESLVPRVSSPGERAEILVELAALSVRVDQVERAVAMLETSLESASGLANQAARGALYEGIIRVAVDAGEPAFPIVAETINRALVIDDLWIRALVLTNTAERYRRQGLGQSGNLMIQQAIPAAGSIGSPWYRAAALSAVALSFHVTGDYRSAEQYAQRAGDQLIGLTVLSLQDSDARVIVDVVGRLARLGRFTAASQVAAVIPQAHIRVEALRELAVGYARAGDRSSAFITLTRAVSEAERAGSPVLIAGAYAAIAEGYARIGEEQLAYLNSEFALGVAHLIADEYARAAVYERLAPLYVAAGESAQLEARGNEFMELFPRQQLSIAVSRAYRDNQMNQAAVEVLNRLRTDTIYRSASESARFAVLQQYAALFEIDIAFELLADIHGAFLRARALAAIGAARDSSGAFYSGPIVVP